MGAPYPGGYAGGMYQGIPAAYPTAHLFYPPHQIPPPPSDYGAPGNSSTPATHVPPPGFRAAVENPLLARPQYGNLPIDPAYVAHLEAVQQRFAHEIAAQQHLHNVQPLYPGGPPNVAFPHQQLRHRTHHQQHDPNNNPNIHPHHPHHQHAAQVNAGFGVAVGGAIGPEGGNGAPQAAANNARPWVRQYVFQFELNWSLISKLILLVILLGQEASSQRVYVLSSAAVVIYLWQTGRLHRLRHLAGTLLPTPTRLFDVVAPPVVRAPADADGEGHGPPSPETSASQQVERRAASRVAVMLSYTYSFCYGFICSLLPSWEPTQLPKIGDLLYPQRGDENEDRTREPSGGVAADPGDNIDPNHDD
jgi:hypothetical protein